MISTLAHIKRHLGIEADDPEDVIIDGDYSAHDLMLVEFMRSQEGKIWAWLGYGESEFVARLVQHVALHVEGAPDYDSCKDWSVWVWNNLESLPVGARSYVLQWAQEHAVFEEQLVKLVHWQAIQRGLRGFGDAQFAVVSASTSQGGATIAKTYKDVDADVRSVLKIYAGLYF